MPFLVATIMAAARTPVLYTGEKGNLWEPYTSPSPSMKRRFQLNLKMLEARKKGDTEAEKKALDAIMQIEKEDQHSTHEIKLNEITCNVDVKMVRSVDLLNHKIGLKTTHSCQGDPNYEMGMIGFNQKHTVDEILKKLSKVFKAKPREVPAPTEEPVSREYSGPFAAFNKFRRGRIYKIGPVLVRHRVRREDWQAVSERAKEKGIDWGRSTMTELRFRPRDLPNIEKALEAAK